MIFNEVNFPQPIIEAIENDSLVIFAGAGVSMGSPAGLPSFEQLAKDLAEGSGKELKEPKEPIDRFIESLPFTDKALKKRTAVKISEASSHTPLHENILRIFVQKDFVKVVTTNFDALFESAAEVLWDVSPCVYTAPALPLGSNFKGIVHLHGAVDTPESIVLTDKDFGRAYLTEGWARRFLVSLFEHYTVLFVGYTHEDTVLQYLARALPDRAQGKRFSLVGATEMSGEWDLLGIIPVCFAQDNDLDFSHLNTAVSHFADFSNRRPSGWKFLIGNIAKRSPNEIDLSDQDTIRHAIKDISKLRYFCQTATSVDWFVWLDNEQALEVFFRNNNSDDSADILGKWVCDNIVVQNPSCVIQVIAKYDFNIGEGFRRQLSHKVRQIENPAVFEKWLDVLLQKQLVSPDDYGLQFLAERCNVLGMHYQSLIIFEKMASSKIVIEEPLSSQLYAEIFQGRVTVTIESSEHSLNQVWEKCLQPYLKENAHSLLDICAKLLIRRGHLHRTWNEATDDFDLDNYRRSAIAVHTQDSYRETLDVVIDSARGAIETLAELEPDLSKLWITKNVYSASHLLRRIAIHGIGFIPVDADDRAKLLLQFGILEITWRREAFEIIENNYADFSNDIKKSIIATVLKFQSNNAKNASTITANEHVEWLTMMSKTDSECALASNAIAAIESVHGVIDINPHPGLTSWSGVARFHTQAPWSADELVSKKSDVWFDEICTYLNSDQFTWPNESGLLQVVEDAAKQNREWLFSFADYLVINKLWKSDVWPYLFGAIVGWPEDKKDSGAYLKLLSRTELIKRFPREILDILLACVITKGIPYIDEMLEETNALASVIWEAIEPSQDPIQQERACWFASAINTTEGKIAQYWIHALDASAKCGGMALSEPYRGALTSLCQTGDLKTAFTIPIITQQLSFLTSIDQQWAKDVIYPLFDSTDDNRSSQAWHGFLASRGPTEIVCNTFNNTFENAISRLESILPHQIDNFIEFCAVIALWELESPLDHWVPNLLKNLPIKDQSTFSSKVGSLLQGMSVEDVDRVWNSWLAQYWANRLDGSPIPFSEQEVTKMLEWLPHLGNHFPSAVDFAVSMKKPKLQNISLLHKMNCNNYAELWPNDVARLCTYLLSCSVSPHSLYSIEDVISKIPIIKLDADVLNDLNEALIASGRPPLAR